MSLPNESEGSEETPNYTGYDSDEWSELSDELRQFDEEWAKSEGFDVDFSKLTHTFGSGFVNLEGSGLAEEPETNRELLNRLCNMAISYYNENTGISLEFVKVLRANYHPSAAITLYMTFEATGNQTKPFQTVIRYLPGDTEVCSCMPKP